MHLAYRDTSFGRISGPITNMNETNFSVLIPDGETHILTEVIYSLSQIKGLKLYVMSNKRNISLRYSRHIRNFSFYPKTLNEMEWIAHINKELDTHEIDVIMPIYEHGIRTLTKYKQQLSQPERLVSLPQLEAFDIANNKGLLASLLKDHKIPRPYTIPIHTAVRIDYESLFFPVIVKKVDGVGGGRDVHLFKSKSKIDRFLKNKPEGDYILQEYIEGYDVDCSVLCNEGVILAYTMQKGTMYGRNKFVPQLSLKFLFEKELLDIVTKLIKTLNWSGVAHIDLRYDSKDQKFKVIEINPRFWATVDASCMAGVNFPYLLCLHNLNNVFETPQYDHIKYLSLRGLVTRLRKLEVSKLNVLLVWRHTPLRFALKDPIPALCTLMRIFFKNGISLHLKEKTKQL